MVFFFKYNIYDQEEMYINFQNKKHDYVGCKLILGSYAQKF